MFNLVATLFGVEQWLVIMVLVLLLFGGKKIPELMRGVGRGVGELQKGLDEGKRALQSSLHEDEEVKARRAEKLETEKDEVVSANPK